MRILHVLHSFPPQSHGGIETYVQALCKAQRVGGDSPSVFAGQDAGEDHLDVTESSQDGLTVFRLRPPERKSDPVLARDGASSLIFERLLERGFDLVHVHHWHNVTSDVVATVRRAGVPTVVTLHDLFAFCPLFFRLREEEICEPGVSRATCGDCIGPHLGLDSAGAEPRLLARERIFRTELELAAARLVLSEDQWDYVRSIPLVADLDFRVLPLPTPETTPRSESSPTPTSGFRIVTWGGLVPGKGLHVLVRAMAKLVGKLTLTVDHYGRVLDADYAERLVNEARGALRLKGPYDDATLTSVFPGYDLMVFPSLYRETHGYVVDEALQLGLPVIVSDRGAPKDRIGTRGRTFRAGDSDDLARVIGDVLCRPGALEELRRGESVPPRSLDHHWDELRGLYLSVLSS